MISPEVYNWIILPVLIFFARVTDVSLGTLRIIFTAQGRRNLAPILGFFEVFVWIVAVSQITRGAHSLITYLAYAAGFATGNYVGMRIENRLAIGTLVVRAILPDDSSHVTDMLHLSGYGFTSVDGEGANGPVKLIYMIVKRKDLSEVMAIIHQTRPGTFITIEDVRSTEKGIFPTHLNTRDGTFFGRKSK
jgi:uncharacterized protein YebE (UPF0316 family)